MKRQCLMLSITFSLLLCLSCLSGCSANFGDVSDTPEQVAMHIQGTAHGGQQALNGAHIYMYAASTGAYGGAGIAASTANASKSLLTAASGAASDASGNYYVTTDVQGNFNINGAFACTPGTQVYLYSSGGDPQVGGYGVPGAPNPAATLLAVVGPCASATPGSAFPGGTFVFMNEVSTVAAAYSLAGFATDPLHIGAPSAVKGHSLSATGIANAFKGALNVMNQATGLPLVTTPAGNGTVPVTTINTLADILAVCVNSTSGSSSGCSSLFANTKNSHGTAPTDTATAAINIAQHPGTNVSNLLCLPTSSSPFQPVLSSANDLTLGIKYTASGLTASSSVSIDAEGNVWTANLRSGTTIYALTPLGALVTGEPAGGYGNIAGGVIQSAIDTSGNVWLTTGSFVDEYSNSGTAISVGTNDAGFTATLDIPFGIGIDGSNNVWVTDGWYTTGAGFSSKIAKLNSAGVSTSGSPFSGGNMNGPAAVAIDSIGNAWIANVGYQSSAAPIPYVSVTKVSSSGTFASVDPITNGGILSNWSLAIDSSNNVWVANYDGGGSTGGTTVTKLNNAGAALSGTSGYSGGGIAAPRGIAVDGAGNVWIANNYSASSFNGGKGSITELSSTGTVLSGAANGYIANGTLTPVSLALDGSGNAWVTSRSTYITEVLGLAAPVVTPLAANLASPYTTPASKP